MSMLELVEAGSLDLKLAAFLWLMMEKRASVIVAALPRLAGKTTYLTALLDFLPSSFQVVPTLGMAEDFSFLTQTDPRSTYILVNELSPHMPMYMWDEPAIKLFEALEQGYALGATIHAQKPQEILWQLADYSLQIPPRRLALLHLFLMLHVARQGARVIRRVESLAFVPKVNPSAREIPVLTLARWNPEKHSLVYADSPEVLQAVAQRVAMTQEELQREWTRRQEALKQFWERGIRSSGDLRAAVQEFYARGAS